MRMKKTAADHQASRTSTANHRAKMKTKKAAVKVAAPLADTGQSTD